jgi:hypothetical protein
LKPLRLIFPAVLLASAAALLTPAVARAAPCTYTGPNNGAWDAAGNWSCVAIPGSSDDVTLSANAVLVGTSDETVHNLTMPSPATVAFANSHALTVNGTTTFSGSNASRQTIDGAGTLNVHGLSWTGGEICVSNGATLTLLGALTVPGSVAEFACSTGGSKVVVAPTGSVVQTGGPHVWATAFEVDGSLDVQAGSLQLAAGTGTDDGSLTAETGTTLNLHGNRSLGATGSLGGAGLIDVSAGTLSVPSGGTLTPTNLQLESSATVNGTPALTLPTVTLNGGTLDGTRNRTIHTLTAHDGTLGGNNTTLIDTALTTDGPNRLTFDVTTATAAVDPSWSGTGDICVSNGGVLTIPNGHTLTIPAGVGTLPCSTGGSKVVVAPGGSVVQTGGSRTLTTPLEVDGSLNVQAGSLQLEGGAGSDDGTLTAQGGTTLTLHGNRSLSATGTITGAGTLNVSAGTLSIPSGATFTPTVLQIGGTVTADGTPALVLPTLTFNGGSLDGTRNRTIHTLTAHDGTLGGNNTTLIDTAFTTDGPNRLTFDVTTATTTVSPSWIGVGDICVSNGGTLVLQATLTLGGSTGGFPCSTGGSKVDVNGANGKIEQSGPGTSTFATPVQASGGGTITVGSGQIFSFNGGLTLLTGGTLKGAGTVGGPVTNTSGVVSPGSSPGTLTIGGNYAQGSGGTLAIDVVNSGSRDLLAVGGSASLDGTLAVTDSNLSGPGPYQILTSGGARTGMFSSVTFTFAAHPYTVAYNPNDVTLTNGPPTAVRLLSFSARRSLVGVAIRWRTAQEAAVLGFNVYRDGVRVNRRLVAARGGVAGAVYRVRDLRAGHRYRLQLVRTDGRRAWIATART